MIMRRITRLNRNRLSLLAALTLVASAFTTACHSARAEESPPSARPPLVGRVEAVGGGGEPQLPMDLLKGTYDQANGIPYRAGVDQTGSLPADMRGEWDGTVKITQLQTYPELHPEPYCQQFIQEIDHFFKLGKGGQINLKFAERGDGVITVKSSDVYFSGGLRIELANTSGPALVPGGYNVPTPVKNSVSELGPGRVEQTRVDYVRIVDRERRPIHDGYTEVSALYQIVGPRRLRMKIVNIDYDQQGKPLWKTLMEGEARRWSSR